MEIEKELKESATVQERELLKSIKECLCLYHGRGFIRYYDIKKNTYKSLNCYAPQAFFCVQNLLQTFTTINSFLKKELVDFAKLIQT